jgi:predicted Holliday junction resolvase-like endonuclease
VLLAMVMVVVVVMLMLMLVMILVMLVAMVVAMCRRLLSSLAETTSSLKTRPKSQSFAGEESRRI